MSTGPATSAAAPFPREALLEVVRRHWGFDTLRPLQEQAMRAVLEARDSLLVLPTGGGKSLCYQAPAVLREQLTVVISPLISLMKDQVDGLKACGVPAVQLNSALSPGEQREAERAVTSGSVRLLFASPERMATGSFRGLLKHVGVRTFAIDEAHCISHWGHDFRPEYRQLRQLKQHFPLASIHGFTATATEPVRADIVEQLGLQGAEVLVGNFDRPNLTYRVVPRYDQFAQVLETIQRHPGEAGIIYCLRRRDVDDLTPILKAAGVNAVPYHAGMEASERKATHDLFTEEKCDVVVATVAFGMGIDRSNIRYVLHTGMPKSIEHYQQETGRAGRDGLEAECVLLYSTADAVTWRKLMQKSVEESQAEVDPQYLESAFRHISDMEAYCRPITCRHRSLVAYFGQKYEAENCGACDLCLGDVEPVPDAQTIARKILSCVFRVNESFGAAYVTEVLCGSRAAVIRERGHDTLTTFGLLSDHKKSEVRDFIQQLIGQGALIQAGNEYPILKLNTMSWDVMKDRATVRLLAIPIPDRAQRRSAREKTRTSKAAAASWEGVDRDLFEALRTLRLEWASARGVPPYLIFSDTTLRELARVRPSTVDGLRLLYGIGEAKLRDFGQPLLEALDAHCRTHQLSRDNATLTAPPPARDDVPKKATAGSSHAAILFRKGASLEDVARELGRAHSTVNEYLCDFIRSDRPASITTWVPEAIYRQIAEAAARLGADRLKPLYIEFNEQIPYDVLRLVVTHLTVRGEE